MTIRLFMVLAFVSALMMSSPVLALILVSTSDDELVVDGDCSLREAIESANTNTSFDNCGRGAPGPEPDDIIIPLIDTLTLATPIAITEAVTISGVSATETLISGDGSSQLFQVDLGTGTGDVVFEDLSMIDAFVNNITGGGAMVVDCAPLLRIENVHFRNNVSAGTGLENGPGGALRMRPTSACNARLELIDTTFVGNRSLANSGGAVWLSNSSGGFNSVLINRSQFVDNQSNTGGGALFGFDIPNNMVLNSVFEGNQAGISGPNFEAGGAIYLNANNVGVAGAIFRGLSFVNNRAGSRGGALYLEGSQSVSFTNGSLVGNTLSNTTADVMGHAISLNDNARFTGLFLTLWNNGNEFSDESAFDIRFNAEAFLGHSILANAWPSTDLCRIGGSATLDSLGYLVDQSSSCARETTDQSLTDPDLFGPVRRPTTAASFSMPVMVPKSGSPAVDIGPSTCPGILGTTTTSDQLGRTRPVLDNRRGAADCDAGAIERQSDELPELFQDRFES